MDLDRHVRDLTDRPVTRRRFMRWLAAGTALIATACGKKQDPPALSDPVYGGLVPRARRTIATDRPLAVVADAPDPGTAVRRAVDALGGMGKFVKPGDVVVVKPNIGWDRTPELAANTNPEAVAAAVALALAAGAKEVRVFDNCCNDERRCYASSGIAAAATAAGATVGFPAEWKYQPGQFPANALLGDWPLNRDAIDCDVFINLPVAKHHGLTEVSLGMKNLMGICGGSRGEMHRQIDRKLVELTRFVAPELTIIDGWRVLLRNGPTGGDVTDVAERRTVIASADPVLADARAAALLGHDPSAIGHIRAAAAAGLGSLDLAAAGA